MTVEKNINEQHGKANGHVPDQVYQGPDGFWRVAYKGRVMPEDWTTRDAAESHLNTLRRAG
jgi:hypothetical protein